MKSPKKPLKFNKETQRKPKPAKGDKKARVKSLRRNPDDYYDWYDEDFEKFRRK